MSLFWLILLVAAAGMFGGLLNALLTHNGFVLWRWAKTDDGRIFRPGVFGNVLVGGGAAAISWGLYGPLAAVDLFGATPAAGHPLTLSALVGAALVGVGGARWLTNEVDKNLLREAASEAASRGAIPELSRRMLVSPPFEVLAMARRENH